MRALAEMKRDEKRSSEEKRNETGQIPLTLLQLLLLQVAPYIQTRNSCELRDIDVVFREDRMRLEDE